MPVKETDTFPQLSCFPGPNEPHRPLHKQNKRFSQYLSPVMEMADGGKAKLTIQRRKRKKNCVDGGIKASKLKVKPPNAHIVSRYGQKRQLDECKRQARLTVDQYEPG